MPDFDRALAALIRDLDDRGLLDTTLVMVTSEFGRTPKINRNAGRDHWPKVFSIAMAGGGIKRGYIHGSSDPTGGEPENDPVTVPDWAATVYELMGIDPTRRLEGPGDRPMPINDDGHIIKDILA
jgi:arylsulfatase A-like enzyme